MSSKGSRSNEQRSRWFRTVFTPDDPLGNALLLPELEMLGWSCFPAAQPQGLGPHCHDAFEVCYLVDGSVDWWLGERVYCVGRGDLFVTRPGETHGGLDAVMHPCELFWLQVRIDPDIPLPGLETEQSLTLSEKLAAIEERRFPASTSVPSLFERLIEEHHQGRTPLGMMAARALLHSLLIQVVRDYETSYAQEEEVVPVAPSPAVRDALAFMETRLREPFRIEEVAQAVELHPTRLHERFLREVGQTPAEWRMRRRIAEAKRLLAAPAATVTEVAYELGFKSSQYFATAFKKYTGRTPREYRSVFPLF